MSIGLWDGAARRREPDPDTGGEETKFREQVRDILGMSPFDRADAIYAELRRLKAVDAGLDQPRCNG